MMKQVLYHNSVATHNTLIKGIRNLTKETGKQRSSNLTRATKGWLVPQDLRFTLYDTTHNPRAYMINDLSRYCEFMLGGTRERERERA